MRKHNDRGRRKFLKRLGVGAMVASLAGCLDGSNDSGSDGDTNGDATPAGQTPTPQKEGQTGEGSQDSSEGGDGGDSKELSREAKLEAIRPSPGEETQMYPTLDEWRKVFSNTDEIREENIGRIWFFLTNLKKGAWSDKLREKGQNDQAKEINELSPEMLEQAEKRDIGLEVERNLSPANAENVTRLGLRPNLMFSDYRINPFRQEDGSLGQSPGGLDWEDVSVADLNQEAYRMVKDNVLEGYELARTEYDSIEVWRKGDRSMLVEKDGNRVFEIPSEEFRIGDPEINLKAVIDREKAEELFAKRMAGKANSQTNSDDVKSFSYRREKILQDYREDLEKAQEKGIDNLIRTLIAIPALGTTGADAGLYSFWDQIEVKLWQRGYAFGGQDDIVQYTNTYERSLDEFYFGND